MANIRQVCGPEKLLRPLRNGPLGWKCGLKYWGLPNRFIFKRYVKTIQLAMESTQRVVLFFSLLHGGY